MPGGGPEFKQTIFLDVNSVYNNFNWVRNTERIILTYMGCRLKGEGKMVFRDGSPL